MSGSLMYLLWSLACLLVFSMLFNMLYRLFLIYVTTDNIQYFAIVWFEHADKIIIHVVQKKHFFRIFTYASELLGNFEEIVADNSVWILKKMTRHQISPVFKNGNLALYNWLVSLTVQSWVPLLHLNFL